MASLSANFCLNSSIATLPIAPDHALTAVLVARGRWLLEREEHCTTAHCTRPSVFGRNLQSEPVRRSEQPSGMSLVARM
jgi:hypothetical protein